jgi:hypothetical protein
VSATGDTGSATVRGDEVTVHVTHHQRAQILQLVGMRTLTVTAHATVRAERANANP